MITFGNRIKLLTFTVVFFLVFNSASAQWPTTYGIATINSSYCVTIDTSVPLTEFYQINIVDLNFATEIDARKVFGNISNNRLSYKVDFANHVAYLQVHADRTQFPQDVIWWNNYIASLCQN